jgi:outer membrane protein
MKFSMLLSRIFVGLGLLAHFELGQAVGVLELYRDAKAGDPQYAAAQFEWESVKTLVPQALGQLMPQISFSGSSTKNRTDNDQFFPAINTNRTTNYEFTSKNATLNLSQALIRPQAWLNFTQSQAQVRQADEQLRLAEQDLILRVSQSYFDVLLADDNVSLVGEQKQAIAEQLKQAKRYYEGGLGTITDINEAQARYDIAVAQEISALNNREIRLRAMEQLAGKYHPNFSSLGARLALESPQPATVEQWLDFAQSNNPQLKAREAAYDIAQKEVTKSFAAHLPTLDVVASRGRSENPGYTLIDNTNLSTTIGLQLSMPIFAGGSTQARVNQASALKERSRNEVEFASRTVTQNTRQEFLNVVSGISQVKALEQAVKSNELALYSAKKGQEAGTRTIFDVLNSQQLLFSAKRDLAQERYRYVLARLKLRAAAGLLDETDVDLIQSWLDQ